MHIVRRARRGLPSIASAARRSWVTSTSTEKSAVKMEFLASTEYHTGTGERRSQAATKAAVAAPKRSRVQRHATRVRA